MPHKSTNKDYHISGENVFPDMWKAALTTCTQNRVWKGKVKLLGRKSLITFRDSRNKDAFLPVAFF